MIRLNPEIRKWLADDFRSWNHPAVERFSNRSFELEDPEAAIDLLERFVAIRTPSYVIQLCGHDPYEALGSRIIGALSTLYNLRRSQKAEIDANTRELLIGVEPFLYKVIAFVDSGAYAALFRQKGGLSAAIDYLVRSGRMPYPHLDKLKDGKWFIDPEGWSERSSYANAVRDLVPGRIRAAHEAVHQRDWESGVVVALGVIDRCREEIASIAPPLAEAPPSRPVLAIPPPDAALERAQVPLPFPASSQLVDAYTRLPVDLGTVWGLDRGTFLTVVRDSDDTLANLLAVERAFTDTRAGYPATEALPLRWWYRIDVSSFPNGPRGAHDVWQSATASPLTDYALQRGLPTGVVPGLVFDLPPNEVDKSLSSVLIWCEKIFNNVFASEPVAVVIDTGGATSAELERIAKELETAKIGVMVERAEAWRSTNAIENGVATGASGPLHFFARATEPGASLYIWLNDLQARGTQGWKRDGQLRALGQELFPRFGAMQLPASVSADAVVADLDAMLPGDHASPADRELLDLVSSSLFDRLPSLLRAYARSARHSARRASFLYAAQRSEQSIDDWAAGLDGSEDGVLPFEDLRSAPGVRAPADELALALIRRLRREPTSPIDRLLQLLAPLVSPPVHSVLRLYRGDISAADFFTEQHGDTVLYLYQARLALRPERTWLEKVGLQQPEPWWLIAAQPIDVATLGTLLQLPPALRAIFGLCTPSELQVVIADPARARGIADCRRGRPLSIRLSAPS